MKTKLLVASVIASAMAGSIAQAVPIASDLANEFITGSIGTKSVAPIVEPSVYKAPLLANLTLRGSFPLIDQGSSGQGVLMRPDLSDPASAKFGNLKDQNALAAPSLAHHFSDRGVLPKARPLQLASLGKPNMLDDAAPISRSATKSGTILNGGRHFALRQNALAPTAYVLFCMKNKGQCEVGNAAQVTLTAEKLTILKQVNLAVNRKIRPINDRGDVWSVNVSSGDCEDYALTKRARLMRLGFPATALRMAVAITPQGEGHAVLVVSTDRGDMVLDNRNNAIRPFNRTDLQWVKVQGKTNPLYWHAL